MYFTKQKCLVFPSPVFDPTKITHMVELEDNEFNPGFLEKKTELIKHVFAKSLVKMVGDAYIDGQSKYIISIYDDASDTVTFDHGDVHDSDGDNCYTATYIYI